MPHGGKRPNSGRKKGQKPEKRASIEHFLSEIWKRNDKVAIITEILQSNNLRAKTSMVERLMEYEFGKPIQELAGNQEKPIRVIIERIGD